MADMTEAEFLAGMTGQFASQTLVFNEDGTATTRMSFMGQEETQTMYYVVDGNALTMYVDAEKTQSTGTARNPNGRLEDAIQCGSDFEA